MFDVSEYSRREILFALLKGWKQVTEQDIPSYLNAKIYALVSRLDGLLQSSHLDQVKEIAFTEGILIAKEQFT